MRRNLAIAARFLLFHFLSVLATAIFMALLFQFAVRYNGALRPLFGPAISMAFDMTMFYGPFLLIPSALGWWIGGVYLARRGTNPARRPVLQGVLAGLFTIIAFSWDIAPMPLALIGMPVGAFFGWLIYRKLWPDLPGTAPDQTTAQTLR